MTFPFLTPDVFEALIVAVIVVGLVLMALRLRADFTRPLNEPPKRDR